MASTWNADLIEKLGQAVAEEAISKDVQVVLGPTINIHRTPIGGRNFECYSEDPYLSGILAAAFINGIQGQGVGACVKHFVCNDSEFERHTISTEVDERTLREIYLRPFEIAVKRSHPWTIMSSYNRINGVYACSHDYLINQVLKTQWGFQGLVISDWFAAKETVANALGGLDLEMPGPAIAWGEALMAAVNDGSVPESVIDDKVSRLLRVIEWSGRFEDQQEKPEQGLDKPEHRLIAYQAAAEGMVLVKNNGILPLQNDAIRSLAVIGPNTRDFRIMGGGSSSLKSHYVSTPLDALNEKLVNAQITTAMGCLTHKYIPEAERQCLSPDLDSDAQGLLCRFYSGKIGSELVAERVIAPANIRLLGVAEGANSAQVEGYYRAGEAGDYEFGLLSTGQAKLYVNDELLIDNWTETEQGQAFFTQATTEKRGLVSLVEGQSAKIRIEFEANPENNFRAVRYGILPPQPEDSIADAVAVARQADAVLLMVGTNDDWETEGNDREMLELPGDQNELIRQIVRANPKTVVVNNSGSPVAMPWLDDVPAVIQSWFPGQEFGNALVDILLGKINPSGKLPITFPKRLKDTPAYTNYPGEFGKVNYGEGLFVGYRWYDKREIEPLLSFGHGLSYTSFDYSDLRVSDFDRANGAVVSFSLSNSGSMDGMETAQVYIEPLRSPVARPKQELKAFIKVDLAVGEKKPLSIRLDAEAFAHWDLGQSNWLVAPGAYRIHVGSSSRDFKLTEEITL